MANQLTGPARTKQTMVLCFDGTGNKFSGTEKDSNILKIYRMLDKSDGRTFTFYQPGIGTYVTTNHIGRTVGALARLKSWYIKLKDQAIGSSFAEHVMGGYRFLMRYYTVEDDLYLFGFSRGAYTARFLAEILEHVGLLSAGNEELTRFAWKTYAKWASRRSSKTEKQKEKEKAQYDFMIGFRETFGRRVRRIRFLGLFDTVNSVPAFENAWMQRSKFPYTAKSSAKTIRHAVSIDERRAKFRQDLMLKRQKTDEHDHLYDTIVGAIETAQQWIKEQGALLAPQKSDPSKAPVLGCKVREWSDTTKPQDIQEVWFPGCHGDIGGGWSTSDDEHRKIAHVALVWMVKEAETAGLKFDPVQMAALGCCPDAIDDNGVRQSIPKALDYYHGEVYSAATAGKIHDSLVFGSGVSSFSVAAWRLMEYLPFRRMDLQSDGSWKAIRWPLPMGETRDIPNNAQIHISALDRMKHDPKYRPGNLIIGGGGRGVRTAPEKYGTGEWEVFKNAGDKILETHVRTIPPEAE